MNWPMKSECDANFNQFFIAPVAYPGNQADYQDNFCTLISFIGGFTYYNELDDPFLQAVTFSLFLLLHQSYKTHIYLDIQCQLLWYTTIQ